MTYHPSADRDSVAAVLESSPPIPSRGSIAAQLGGTISDSQVAVGNGNMQVSTGGGDCIINQAVHRPPRPREAIRVLPRRQPELWGRDDEVALALATVADREPVQFHGRRGAGKTALLRYIAHASSSSSTAACPEGIVYFRAAGTSLDDLLQTLFDFLFECDIPTKRTPGQLASDLAGWEVLFVLDDVGLDEGDLETLLDTVPMSVFVFSSAERTLWGTGEGAELRGLSQDAALALFESRLRRPLSDGGRAAFAAQWGAGERLPQHLVKDAERMRAAARDRAHGAQPDAGAAPELTADDRELLRLTAALGGVPLGTQALAELSDRPDAAARLARLEDRGLTQSHSPRYSATGPSLLDDREVADLRHRMLAYFIDRAERGATDRERPRDDLDPIVALLRWGQTAAPHADVVRLARASDTIAAGAGLWDAWRTILDIGLASARAIGDRDGEAWALHQLGTRALCLEDKLDAHRMLREALRLRRALGDRTGAANTQHNMRFLPGGPAGPGNSAGGPPLHPESGGAGGAAGGGGISLLAPASWPLLGVFAAIVLTIGAIAAATPVFDAVAGTQDVVHEPAALLRDRPVLGPDCADPNSCVEPIVCSGASGCSIADVHPAPGRRDDRHRRVKTVVPTPVPPVPVPPAPVPPAPVPPPPVPPTPDPESPGVIKGASTVDDLAPPCDHFVAVETFVHKELGLPAKLVASLALAEIVHEQAQIVHELIDGLHCDDPAASGLLARLLAPLVGTKPILRPPTSEATP